MSKVQTVDATESIEKINDIIARDGCIIIKNVLRKPEVKKLSAELRPHFEETENCHGDFYGYSTKRLSSLVAKSVSCQNITINPVILGVMDAFLLKTSERYQLHLTQAIQIGPGEFRQPLHRDDVMFPFDHPDYEAMINCMWAVDDFTSDNGATLVVPGSHKWQKDRVAQDHEIVQGVMESGSVLIWLGSLLHAGGTNNTQKSRTGIVISYCLGWLRQAENSYLAIPITIARQFPENLQRLLGYFVHSPNLGCVEGQDPIKLLQGENLRNKGFEEFLPDFVKPLLKEHRKLSEAA